MPARSDVARAPPQAASTTKTGTTPAIVTVPATDLKGGPAIEDFADGDIEVQEMTMDAHRADAPSGPRVTGFNATIKQRHMRDRYRQMNGQGRLEGFVDSLLRSSIHPVPGNQTSTLALGEKLAILIPSNWR